MKRFPTGPFFSSLFALHLTLSGVGSLLLSYLLGVADAASVAHRPLRRSLAFHPPPSLFSSIPHTWTATHTHTHRKKHEAKLLCYPRCGGGKGGLGRDVGFCCAPRSAVCYWLAAIHAHAHTTARAVMDDTPQIGVRCHVCARAHLPYDSTQYCEVMKCSSAACYA